MARFQYPWDKLNKIGKSFVLDFPARISEKEKRKIWQRLRSAASYHQTRNENVRYEISVMTDEIGKHVGIRVKRVSPKERKKGIRLEE